LRRRFDGLLAGKIYFDPETQPQYYEAVKSADLEHWQDTMPRGLFPEEARQGTFSTLSEWKTCDLQYPETNQDIKP